MSDSRKVVEWVDVSGPRIWKAKLECGHEAGQYDDLDDGARKAIEDAGGIMTCIYCQRAESEVAELEKKLADAKARLKPVGAVSTSPKKSEGQ